MYQLNKTRDTESLKLSLKLLGLSCSAVECRVFLAKGTLLSCLEKLLPSCGKKGAVPGDVLDAWMAFLMVFSCYPEGQIAVCKVSFFFNIKGFLAEDVSRSRRRNVWKRKESK